MTDQKYVQPPISLLITTYELSEPTPGNYQWVATVSHIFHGDSLEHVWKLVEAHKRTDTFFAGSFEGRYNDIILMNSEPKIID